jgi:hypothetical protein
LTNTEILGEFYCAVLSQPAQKLYCAIWHMMATKQATELWLPDAEASTRSRVLIQHIPAAQSELANGGLMLLVPGVTQVHYRFVEDPSDPDSIGAEA